MQANSMNPDQTVPLANSMNPDLGPYCLQYRLMSGAGVKSCDLWGSGLKYLLILPGYSELKSSLLDMRKLV